MSIKDNFQEWKNDPITKVIFNELKERIELLKDQRNELATLDTVSDIGTAYVILTSRIQSYEDLIGIEFEDIDSDEQEEV